MHDTVRKHNKGTISAKALNWKIQQDKGTENIENRNGNTKKVFLSSATSYPLWGVHDTSRKALNLVGNFYNS